MSRAGAARTPPPSPSPSQSPRRHDPVSRAAKVGGARLALGGAAARARGASGGGAAAGGGEARARAAGRRRLFYFPPLSSPSFIFFFAPFLRIFLGRLGEGPCRRAAGAAGAARGAEGRWMERDRPGPGPRAERAGEGFPAGVAGGRVGRGRGLGRGAGGSGSWCRPLPPLQLPATPRPSGDPRGEVEVPGPPTSESPRGYASQKPGEGNRVSLLRRETPAKFPGCFRRCPRG